MFACVWCCLCQCIEFVVHGWHASKHVYTCSFSMLIISCISGIHRKRTNKRNEGKKKRSRRRLEMHKKLISVVTTPKQYDYVVWYTWVFIVIGSLFLCTVFTITFALVALTASACFVSSFLLFFSIFLSLYLSFSCFFVLFVVLLPLLSTPLLLLPMLCGLRVIVVSLWCQVYTVSILEHAHRPLQYAY